MTLNKILGSFTKTLTKLEQFVVKSDQQLDDCAHELEYLEGRVKTISDERKTALSVKTKIEELLN